MLDDEDDPLFDLPNLLWGFLGMALGAFLVWYGQSDMKSAVASESWPQAPAIVLRSELHKSKSKIGSVYTPKIKYRYRIDKAIYENDKLTFGSGVAGKAESEAFIKDYPKGKQFKVYYQPDDPKVSVIKAGHFGGTVSNLVYIGQFIVLFCLWLFLTGVVAAGHLISGILFPKQATSN